MPELNPVEKEALEVLEMLEDAMWRGPVRKMDFVYLKGKLRDAIYHLRQKELGCESGKHAGACSCR